MLQRSAAGKLDIGEGTLAECRVADVRRHRGRLIGPTPCLGKITRPRGDHGRPNQCIVQQNVVSTLAVRSNLELHQRARIVQTSGAQLRTGSATKARR